MNNEKNIDSPFYQLIIDSFQDSESTPKHHVYDLNTGSEALLARVHLIRSARKSILIQTFIWDNDECGKFIAYELIQAARRGVEVKILIDQFASAHDVEFATFFSNASENLKIKFYSPISDKKEPTTLEVISAAFFSRRKINQRMHNKTFVVDNAIAIVGGRNYQNDYFDRSSRRNFKDRDVLMVGSVAKDVAESFHEYWNFELCFFAHELEDVKQCLKDNKQTQIEKECEQLKDNFLFQDITQNADSFESIEKTFTSKMFEVEKIKFVADHPGKNKKLRSTSLTEFEISLFIAQAQESVLMQTPYLVLDKITVKSFKKLKKIKPNIDIRISTNSLAGADNLIAYTFAYQQRKEFVKDLKFRIFELKPEPKDMNDILPTYEMLKNNSVENYKAPTNPISNIERAFEFEGLYTSIHSKTYVVDEDMTWVGSFNIDPRSARLNTEVGVIIWDQEFTQHVKTDILRDMSSNNSWTIAKKNKRAIRSYFSGFLGWLFRLGILAFFPYRYTESFDLRDGKEEISCFHPDFYKHYKPLGMYPGVKRNTREVEIELIKSLGPFLKNIV